MLFVKRWALLFLLVVVAGAPFYAGQFTAVDDVVTVTGDDVAVIVPAANDQRSFIGVVDRVTIVEEPRYGTVTVADDLTVTYTPDTLVTVDSFRYEASTTTGGAGTATVVVEREPGPGVTVTAPVEVAASGRWWVLPVVVIAVVVAAVSFLHRLRTRRLADRLTT